MLARERGRSRARVRCSTARRTAGSAVRSVDRQHRRRGRSPCTLLRCYALSRPAYMPGPGSVTHLLVPGRCSLAALDLDRTGVMFAHPIPPQEQLDPDTHNRVLADGLRDVERQGIRGKAVTPF